MERSPVKLRHTGVAAQAHVIFIFIDALPRITERLRLSQKHDPNIDRLAARSSVFDKLSRPRLPFERASHAVPRLGRHFETWQRCPALIVYTRSFSAPHPTSGGHSRHEGTYKSKPERTNTIDKAIDLLGRAIEALCAYLYALTHTTYITREVCFCASRVERYYSR